MVPALSHILKLSASDVAAAALGLFVFSAAVEWLTAKGPMMWPVFGLLPHFLCNLGDIYEWVTAALNRAGGTFEFYGVWFGRLHGVITVEPANIEYMLKTRFANFPKGPYYRQRFAELLGDGIFNADDDMWREQRRAATVEMHSGRFVEYSLETMRELVRGKLLPLLGRVAANNARVDLQDVFLRFTFDNICTAAFGVDPGCLAFGFPRIPFAKAFEEATELSLFRFTVPPFVWKPMRLLNVGTERRLKTAVRVVRDFAEKTVSDRLEELRKVNGLNERSDLLSRLMEAEESMTSEQPAGAGAKSLFSDKFFVDFCISFILAGRDTSSVALAWFFWLLDGHPRVEKLILDEISKIVSQRRDKQPELDEMTFSVEELKKMEYLQAALSESLRLYPSVPIDFKEVMEDDVLPDGTPVRKGDRVMYAIYSMARSEAIWGKDCAEFRPERWLRDGKFVSESQFKYTVFNAGPRLCVGKKFAYMQMKTVAASILQRFHVEVVAGQKVVPKLTTTLYMKNGLQVKFKPRATDSSIPPYS